MRAPPVTCKKSLMYNEGEHSPTFCNYMEMRNEKNIGICDSTMHEYSSK